MPQGLHNSPEIFHRALEDTLNPLTGTGNVIHYVDDILIATEGSLDDHLLLVDEVLLTLGKAGFKLNKEKAQIAQTEVQYLGYTITQSYRALTDDRRKCIAELPRPHTLNSLQKVLGTANYLRDFIPDFANVVTPLYSLLKGKSKPSDVLEWTEEHDKAFTSLKENLCCAPVLGLPNPKKSFHLQVDANENTLSGVLAQDHGGKLRPIAYYSRKKSTIEQGFDPCTQHNDSKLINVESSHGHSNAIQVSHTQWCVISEMNSFTYGGLTCPADHSFCLEVTEDFSMGQIDILGRMPKDAEVSPWWDDTFYEHGTQALIDTMDLVQNVILQTEYHLSQAQGETNLARKTAQILSSSSTRSAQTAYTWWDWVPRGCAVGSALIFSFTLFQCCYFRHLITSVKASTNTILTLSPLKLPTMQRLK